jgi:hypothetical protein
VFVIDIILEPFCFAISSASITSAVSPLWDIATTRLSGTRKCL